MLQLLKIETVLSKKKKKQYTLFITLKAEDKSHFLYHIDVI